MSRRLLVRILRPKALLSVLVVLAFICFWGLALAMLADRLGFLPEPEKELKTGLIVKESGAYKGYTLVAPMNETTTSLLDMDGKAIHSWDSEYGPGCTAYLLENGHLLRAGRLPMIEGTKRIFGDGGNGGIVEEFTWDGELIWSFKYSDMERLHHHDIEILPNGNILMLAWERHTIQEAIDAGRHPGRLGSKGLSTCHIIEVKPLESGGGEIVWEWHAWDHLVQQYDSTKANYGGIREHPELINLNPTDTGEYRSDEEREQLQALGYIDSGSDSAPIEEETKPTASNSLRMQIFYRDWNHTNSIDYNPALDQIILSVRSFHEIWIIDHSTTSAEAAGHTGGRYGKGGDLLYRWGNPEVYNAGTIEDRQLFDQHDANWIEPGLPGEGNILIFNNGNKRPTGQYSTVIEIVPPLEPDGSYALDADSVFGPVKPVWMYPDPIEEDFYSGFASGAQRLPNGNTLICSATEGLLLEVTADKEIVWKYISPFVPVFRVHRYGMDYLPTDD